MTRKLPLFLLLLSLAGFAFGLVELFKLRFEVGDVYPAYSSLRSDPLGTMALHESLEQMPHLSVRRDFSSENQLPDGKGVTYLHLAAARSDWLALPEELAQEINSFVARGGRLVVAFLPETDRPFLLAGPAAPPAKKSVPGSKAEKEQPAGRVSLKKLWGLELGFAPLEVATGSAYEPARVLREPDLPLPNELAWHSGMVFTNLSASWQTVYARGNQPVLVERKFGPGSVVMSTDCYFLSNEAMARDRHADLLSWLIGSGQRVVFDEAHLGVVETSGVSTLMRRYHFQGLLAGLLLLAGLFIWKNSLSFVPPLPEGPAQESIVGRDSAAGFVNLLRRNIAPREVLRVCFEQWTGSQVKGGRHSIHRVDQAQEVLETEAARAKVEQDPVRAYREICAVLRAGGKPASDAGMTRGVDLGQLSPNSDS